MRSITTSLLNAWRNSKASRATRTHGLGVVAVDVEDRRLDHAGHVGGVHRGARRRRGGGEADLVVDHHVHGAAGAVAAQLRHVQRLGDHALARERRVAVQQRRGRTVKSVPPLLMMSCLARTTPSRTGSTASRCEGLAASETLICSPSRTGEGALGAQVVLHVAGAVHRLRVEVALELAEDLGVATCRRCWPARSRRPRWAMPMTTSSRRASAAASMTASSSGMIGLAALEREPLLADVLGLQERSRTPRRRSAGAGRAAAPRAPAWCASARCGPGSSLRCFGSWMCMNSTPTVRQYESRSTPRMLAQLHHRLGRRTPPTANSRSRSQQRRARARRRPGRGACAAGTPAGRCRP